MSDLTITEVSKKYNIKPDTIRYYERIGLLPKIPRKNNGNRYFNEGMQGWIEMIVCLRHSGVPVEKLIDYADMLRVGDETLQAREDLLKEQLKELEQKKKDLNRSINRLKHKISLYESGEIRENKSYFEEYKILDD
ncbi:MerR family transcriptional regulator [Lactobacillus rodentium]|uniref:MerR family transcriptional regulator n=1 Tax=Lactobacillus rodentium TaxID=947835 RepID=A0A2Z6T6T8_9LACO|nr:MerR family transcriptional regulator [Lactobacillus rodentium]MCR1894582.1 MerR family transcriptional regulator [Lactobacillus rodentium]GBG04944.1 MerR family transcriptional regulator [Lactobacillus rodentium]